MITEQQIDEMISLMETEDFEDSFVSEQQEFWHYISSDAFSGLSKSEHQLLFFVISVIFHTCQRSGHPLVFDIDTFQDKEEKNWASREAKDSWTAALDDFFQGHGQEDLLAFAEDMLVLDDDEQISDIGKEIIFITAKSYIDLI